MGLVYADPVQFAARRRLYLVAPLVFALAIVVGQAVSLTLVALAAGLWNAEHTLMQRYGLTRIYGRKAGDEHGPLEKPMLVSWLVLALVWVAGFVDIERVLRRVRLGSTNERGIELLHHLRGGARWLLLPALVVATVLTVRWWRAERALGARGQPGQARVRRRHGGVGGHRARQPHRRARGLRRLPCRRVLRHRAPQPAGPPGRRAGGQGRCHPQPPGAAVRRLLRGHRGAAGLHLRAPWPGTASPSCSSARCTSSTTASCGSSGARRWPPASGCPPPLRRRPEGEDGPLAAARGTERITGRRRSPSRSGRRPPGRRRRAG